MSAVDPRATCIFSIRIPRILPVAPALKIGRVSIGFACAIIEPLFYFRDAFDFILERKFIDQFIESNRAKPFSNSRQTQGSYVSVRNASAMRKNAESVLGTTPWPSWRRAGSQRLTRPKRSGKQRSIGPKRSGNREESSSGYPCLRRCSLV